MGRAQGSGMQWDGEFQAGDRPRQQVAGQHCQRCRRQQPQVASNQLATDEGRRPHLAHALIARQVAQQHLAEPCSAVAAAGGNTAAAAAVEGLKVQGHCIRRFGSRRRKGSNGQTVPGRKVARWTSGNLRRPILTHTEGMLCPHPHPPVAASPPSPTCHRWPLAIEGIQDVLCRLLGHRQYLVLRAQVGFGCGQGVGCAVGRGWVYEVDRPTGWISSSGPGRHPAVGREHAGVRRGLADWLLGRRVASLAC